MSLMRVGIVCFWDRAATPYLAKYERILEEKRIDFDVIFWNRSGVSSKFLKANELEIVYQCSTNPIYKLFNFISWRSRTISILRKNKYDFLIILSTYPAVLLYRYLKANFSNKYIFDIRDYSMESNRFFLNIVTNLIEKSALTTISSNGYMRWLNPSDKIVTNHNITVLDNNYNKEIRLKSNSVLNFTFVGNIRLDKQTEAALFTLRNSSRYHSGFVGRILPTCDIQRLCRDSKIRNVYFEGQFTNKDKPLIYSKIDLINAVYANDSIDIRLADSTPLPNRVYDSAVFKCPIVASKGTYLAELIDKYSLGFSINGFDNDLESQFDSYVDNFDETAFRDGCNRFLNDVMVEEAIFNKKCNDILDNVFQRKANNI